MSEKYIDLAERIGEPDDVCSCYDLGRDDALEYLDRHPDKAPGLTITETELRRQIDKHLPDGTTFEQVSMFMIDIDHPVVPEPTNAEKLAKMVCRACDNLTPIQRDEITRYFDEAGVKAPEEQR